ncbi:uncharacterized protein LOC113296368 [Papaver somniferum]|uniref:uncharacterized protein LOC113296368 n=1 Tax=Papaver somniferum TaxID=3469 RepID=UPI000E6F8C1A|nr:uncharacterized protein LOC113296368 [Papaver somniferum]
MVGDFWASDHWNFPAIHLERLVVTGVEIKNMSSPLRGEDSRIWIPDLKGVFSVSSAKDVIRQKYPIVEWSSLIWRSEVHPVLAAQNWKFIRGACDTYDLLQERFKTQLASKCSLCGNAEETLDHVLFSCSFATRAWNWIAQIFGLNPNSNLVVSCKAAKGRSQIIRELWLVANLVIKSELWALRNKGVFEHKKPNWSMFFKRVLKLIQDYTVLLKGYMKSNVEDVFILDYFRVQHRRVKGQQPVECFWQPPKSDELQICCDGAAKEILGRYGAGVVARDASCNVIGAMLIGLGVTTNYLAELYGIIVGMEWATRWGVRRICIRSDSYGVVEALKNSNLPWFARQRWLMVCRNYDSIRFIHTYREANFATDSMAKRGCYLDNGVGMHYEGRPIFFNFS